MVKYIGKIVLGEDMYHIKDIEARTNLIDKSEKGAASGVATLDANGKVPSSLLPSYVDDVVEGYYHNGNFYNTFTPGEDPDTDTYSDLITPETGKIYVDKPTSYTYRWSGSVYILIQGGATYTSGDGIDITNDEISVDGTVVRFGDDDGSAILPDVVPDTFLGTCSTVADTAAKTSTITGYELVTHGGVVITFTNGISVANATLNISSKGAKPIYYRGAALTAGVVKATDIVTLIYDGTNYVITNIERGYDEPYYDSSIGFIVYPDNYPVHYDSTSGMIVFD